jgi:hypothetical protein
MKIAMIATKSQVYAGRRIEPGTRFEVNGSGDARLLTAIGRAIEAPPAPEPAPAPVAPRQIARVFLPKVDATETPDESDAPKVKRTYRRRDMTAES